MGGLGAGRKEAAINTHATGGDTRNWKRLPFHKFEKFKKVYHKSYEVVDGEEGSPSGWRARGGQQDAKNLLLLLLLLLLIIK